MIIKVLGPGCRSCVTLKRVTREAVEALGINATVEKVEDYQSIASYGLMRTPRSSHRRAGHIRGARALPQTGPEDHHGRRRRLTDVP